MTAHYWAAREREARKAHVARIKSLPLPMPTPTRPLLVSSSAEEARLAIDKAGWLIAKADFRSGRAETAAPLPHGKPLTREEREAEARKDGGWQCARARCRAWNRKHLKVCRGCGKRGRPSATMEREAFEAVQAEAEAINARLAGPWQIISKGE